MDKIKSLIEKLSEDKEEYEKELTEAKEKFNCFVKRAEAYQLLDLNFYSKEYERLIYISKQIHEIEIKIRTLNYI